MINLDVAIVSRHKKRGKKLPLPKYHAKMISDEGHG